MGYQAGCRKIDALVSSDPQEAEASVIDEVGLTKEDGHRAVSIETVSESSQIGGEWMNPGRAAALLSISKSTLLRRGDSGVYPMRRLSSGEREFLIKAHVREAIVRRRQLDADTLLTSIVRLAEDGKNVTQILFELECPPDLIAKTLAAHSQAIEAQYARDTRRRAYELLTGDSNIPTNWAWVTDRFTRKYDFARASNELENWEHRGGDKAAVSPLVRRALSNETAWQTALALWTKHESNVVKQHIEEETAKRGLETRHALVEIWDKEQKHLEAGERMRRNQQREDDRHQGHQEVQTAKRRGRPLGSKNKPKFVEQSEGEE